ncbi:MAG TPA: hypothetical protein ENJ90_05025 [Devosia sp.]|nr:hypothetical protein [Devosia sp.]
MRPDRCLLSFSLGALALVLFASPAKVFASDGVISAQPIEQYQSLRPGDKVGDLIWRGGLILEGPEVFGGVSGIDFLDDKRFVMVTDQGQFVSGVLKHRNNGRPKGLENVQLSPLQNSSGIPLPENYTRDAESIATIFRGGRPAAVRVSFENLTRVADFDLIDGRPVGAARKVTIPDWLSTLRTNESLESVCIAPAASPISGSTLLIPENVSNEQGDHSAWLLGRRDVGALSLSIASGFNPTDCAFLPDGDLLVLERGVSFLGFKMQVRRIRAENVAPGALMQGEVILSGFGGDIDNMEGLAVRIDKDGSTRIILVSDDNFNDWQRTLLLEFELPA